MVNIQSMLDDVNWDLILTNFHIRRTTCPIFISTLPNLIFSVPKKSSACSSHKDSCDELMMKLIFFFTEYFFTVGQIFSEFRLYVKYYLVYYIWCWTNIHSRSFLALNELHLGYAFYTVDLKVKFHSWHSYCVEWLLNLWYVIVDREKGVNWTKLTMTRSTMSRFFSRVSSLSFVLNSRSSSCWRAFSSSSINFWIALNIRKNYNQRN